MTLKEIYISACENKIENKEIYIPKICVSSQKELEAYCENTDFVYNVYELIHGNIVLSKTISEKRIKQTISVSDDNFIKIIEKKYPACACRNENEITFRKALQTAWFYLLIDTAVVSLGLDFSSLETRLNDYLLNDIKNARTTDVEVIHLLTDFLCKYKLYKAAEKESFINPSPMIEFFCGNSLLSMLKKQI